MGAWGSVGAVTRGRALVLPDGEGATVNPVRRGRVTLPAWVDGRGRCPPGHVFVPFFDETLLVNVLTLEAHDPFSKQPDYKKCAVRISRVGVPRGQ